MNSLTELVQRLKSRHSYSRLMEEDEEVTKDDRIVISTLSQRKEDFALKIVEEALDKRTNLDLDFQPAVDIADRMNSRFSRGSTKLPLLQCCYCGERGPHSTTATHWP